MVAHIFDFQRRLPIESPAVETPFGNHRSAIGNLIIHNAAPPSDRFWSDAAQARTTPTMRLHRSRPRPPGKQLDPKTNGVFCLNPQEGGSGGWPVEGFPDR